MNGECPEKIDYAFIKWVWNYRKRSRTQTIEKLEKVKKQKEVFIVKNRKQVNHIVRNFEKNRAI
ncbi:hypothetical protein GCM10010917_00010 [Paenibacillus physcomitrellae]|uniref:Topology modulation protein n=1 Tax=Paenibacillus physcomitrellae TaxID=1619311 RepID=A0ABQ1FK19_9BACL|nr:hypothetical protein GCM10010917_00010 [Paenibacillus physcomitrellae]